MALGLEPKGIRREYAVMIADKIPALKGLTLDEKLILVGELWDELSAHPGAFPQRTEHVRLLQERLEHFRKNPEDVTAWEDVKARILAPR
jgi:putative addiction module component (TIGR02574 family)